MDGEAPLWVTPSVAAQGVRQLVFDSAAAGAPVSYHIYLPDGYEISPRARFPVLYWLHGAGPSPERGVTRIAAFFASAMSSGSIPPILIVFPHSPEEGMWTDSADGRLLIETVFIQDVVSHVDASFRTVPDRHGRILEGFSMGGRGAGRLGFTHPDMFGAVSMLGAGPLDDGFAGPRALLAPASRERLLKDVWGGDLAVYRADGPAAIAASRVELLRASDGPRIRVVVGAEDFTLAQNEAFSAHLDRLGIPHTLTRVPGVGHTALPLLAGLGDAGWEFYRSAAPVHRGEP